MSAQSALLNKLCRALGVEFSDPALLQLALTHRSYGANHNERLEFLGDGILNFVIADMLFTRFAQLQEGDLSRLRAHLVRQDSLHRLALQLELPQCLRLGEGELRSGGHQRPSILADALEAILGAIYLDQGFAVAHACIARLYAQFLAELDPARSMKDAKTRLQEWLQGRKKPLPRYSLQNTSGAAHEQQFCVQCVLDGLGVEVTGVGPSRRLAEQAAAENALKAINA